MSRIRKAYGLNLQQNQDQPVSLSKEVRFRYYGGTRLQVSFDTGPYADLGLGSGTVTGSGTAWHLPRWDTTGTALQDSHVKDDPADARGPTVEAQGATYHSSDPGTHRFNFLGIGGGMALGLYSDIGLNYGWAITGDSGTALTTTLYFRSNVSGRPQVNNLQLTEQQIAIFSGPLQIGTIGSAGTEPAWPDVPPNFYTTLYYDDSNGRTWLYDKSTFTGETPQYRPIPRWEGHHLQAMGATSGALPTSPSFPKFVLCGNASGTVDSAHFGWNRYGSTNNNFEIYADAGQLESGLSADTNWINYYPSYTLGMWQARLQNCTGGAVNSVAGLEIFTWDTASNNAADQYVFIGLEYQTGNVKFFSRDPKGASSAGGTVATGATLPVWFRMVATAAKVDAYWSQDGTTWNLVGTSTWGPDFPVTYGWTCAPQSASMMHAYFEDFSFPGGAPVKITYAQRTFLRFQGMGIQGIADDASTDSTIVTVDRGAGLTVIGEAQNTSVTRGFITLRGDNWTLTDDPNNNNVILQVAATSGTGTGSVGPGTAGRLSKFAGTFGTAGSTTIDNAGLTDDGTIVTAEARAFAIHNTSFDLSELKLITNSNTAAFLRFEHRAYASGGVWNASNETSGELQLFLNSGGASMVFGDKAVTFLQSVQISPPSGYSATPFEIDAVGSTTAVLKVDLTGNLAVIRSLNYIWPTSVSAPTTVVKILQYDPVSTQLSWVAPPAGGLVTGRPYYFPRFDSAGNIADAAHLYEDAVSLYLENISLTFTATPACSAHYTGGAVMSVFQMGQSSPTTDHLFFGPASPTTGAWVKVRAGSAAPKGYFTVNGTGGYFGLNCNDSEVTASALTVRLSAIGDNGVVMQPRATSGAMTGWPFLVNNSAGNTIFSVFGDGGIDTIKAGCFYNWPSATPAPSGGVTKVLGYALKDGSNVCQLQWYDLPTAGAITGTPYYYPAFDSSGTLTNSGKIEHSTGPVHIVGVGLKVDPDVFIGTGNTAAEFVRFQSSNNRVLFGPKTTAQVVEHRAGAAAPQGVLYQDGVNGRLTFGDFDTNNTSSAFILTSKANSDNGLVVVMPASASSSAYGLAISRGSSSNFGVTSIGNIETIRGVGGYAWPTAQAAGVLTNNGGGTLTWTPSSSGSGTVGPGTVNALAKFTASTTVGSSNITDDGATIKNSCTQFVIQRNDGVDLADFQLWGNAGAYGVIRYEHRTPGILFDAGNNAGGELHLFFNVTTPSIALGSYRSNFSGGLRLRLPSGYADTAFDVLAPGSGTNYVFKMDQAGNLTVIRGVAYSWPSAQGASGNVLTNNGSGTLTWAAPPSGGAITGTPNYYPAFDSAGNLSNTGKIEHTGGPVHIVATGLKMDADQSIGCGSTATTFARYQSSNNRLIIGPTTTAQVVEHRAGATAPQGVLYQDGVNGRLTFGDFDTNNTSSAFILTSKSTADNGLVIVMPAAASTAAYGLAIERGSTLNFGVTSNGNIDTIRGLGYTWPTAHAAGALTNNGSGTLSWTTGGGGANTALSNLTSPTAINQSLTFASDGTFNIGDGTNRVGAIYLKNAFFVYTVGSTTSSPKAAGFLDPSSGEATRLLISGNQSVAQGGNALRTQITAYHAIELRGNRQTATAPAFATVSGTDTVGVYIYEETNCVPLRVNSSAALTNDLLQLQNNGTLKFGVNSAGSIWAGGMRNDTALVQPASGAVINVSPGLLDYQTLILDTLSGSFTLLLPLIDTTVHGRRWRLICNRRSSTNTVTIKCASGNDINESGGGSTTGIAMHPNTIYQRDALIVADNSTGEWWYAPLYV